MSIRTILAAVSGGVASDGAVELACDLGARFGAHVLGFHAVDGGIDLNSVSQSSGRGWVDQIEGDAVQISSGQESAFLKAASRHLLTIMDQPAAHGGSASWREESGRAADLIAYEAMFHDLAVIGHSDREEDRQRTEIAGQTLLQSGRPVLLVPAGASAGIGDIVALVWNESPEAVRALAAAEPFLAIAHTVAILSIGHEALEGAVRVAEYLAFHGIAARQVPINPASGAAPARFILQAALNERADLLVMGGYGQVPWRELASGWTAHEKNEISRLPLLISN